MHETATQQKLAGEKYTRHMGRLSGDRLMSLIHALGLNPNDFVYSQEELDRRFNRPAVSDAPPPGERVRIEGLHHGCARLAGTAVESGHGRFLVVRIPLASNLRREIIIVLGAVQRASRAHGLEPTLDRDPVTHEEIWRFQ